MDNYQYHIFSPYRVCPLGAHVDHQHGLVTGFAINKGVDLWFNVREDAKVKLSSLSFEGTVEFDLAKRTEEREKHWGDYARGAKYALKKRFELTHGIEGIIKGSLPVGGLSSSAAVLIAYVMAFAKANGIRLQPFEVVQIAVIALVDPSYKEEIEKTLTELYLKEFPEYTDTFKVYWVQPDDGARFVED